MYKPTSRNGHTSNMEPSSRGSLKCHHSRDGKEDVPIRPLYSLPHWRCSLRASSWYNDTWGVRGAFQRSWLVASVDVGMRHLVQTFVEYHVSWQVKVYQRHARPLWGTDEAWLLISRSSVRINDVGLSSKIDVEENYTVTCIPLDQKNTWLWTSTGGRRGNLFLKYAFL